MMYHYVSLMFLIEDLRCFCDRYKMIMLVSPGKVLKDGGGQAEIPKLPPQNDQPPRTDEDLEKPIQFQ